MALRKQRNLPSGLVAPEAYHRPVRVAIDYDRREVQIQVVAHASQADRQAGRQEIAAMHFTLADAPEVTREETLVDGTKQTVVVAPARTEWTDFQRNARASDVRAAIYAFLKTRAEFSGAVDVIEA